MGVQEKMAVAFEWDSYLSEQMQSLRKIQMPEGKLAEIVQKGQSVEIPSDNLDIDKVNGYLIRAGTGLIIYFPNASDDDKVKEVLRQLA